MAQPVRRVSCKCNSVSHSHSVGQLGFPVFLNGDLESRCKSCGFFVLKTRLQHSPVPADRFVDHYSDWLILVIPDCDAKTHLKNTVGNHLKISLVSLGDNVKGVAQLHTHRLILGCVINLVFSNQLLSTAGVRLVDTQHALGEGQAKVVFLRVLQFNEEGVEARKKPVRSRACP